MSESISVNISGPSFSLLLYENSRCENDQEGFILGEIITKEKRTITDNDQEVISIEKVIKVNSAIPCPKLGLFYDAYGKIDMDKIDSFLNEQVTHIVGWYKFKHMPGFKLSLREKIIMKELAYALSPTAPEHFLFCLLTTHPGSDVGATHLYSQTFIKYHEPLGFQSIPMHIINLKDSHDIYKNSEDCSNTFKDIVKSLKLDTKKSQGYAIVNKIEKALDKHIANVVEELSQREKIMYDLEQEVLRIRKTLNIMNECTDFEDFSFENGTENEIKIPNLQDSGSSIESLPEVVSCRSVTRSSVDRNRGRNYTSTPVEDDTTEKASSISYSQMTQKNKS